MREQKDIIAKRTYLEDAFSTNIKSNPFGQNISADRAFKRTERILAALYLLTNHVPEDDPLRNELRTSAHVLLKQVLELRGGFHTVQDARVVHVLATVREIITLSWMLYVGGFASRENVDILTKALDDFGQFVSSVSSSQLSEDTQFSKQDFIPNEQYSEAVPNPSYTSHSSTQVRSTVPKTQSNSESKKRAPSVKTAVSKGQRRDTILSVLGRGGRLGIKDIARQIPDCSEKTVQRELVSLVDSGVVRKEGEKRWSIYFVA